MQLYRARPISQRPTRMPVFISNEPSQRVRGRWFTSSLADARHHGETALSGIDWEIVAIEIAEDIAETHRVVTTPYTSCGLSPIDFSTDPQTDYIVPTWRMMEATEVRKEGEVRQRDVIDVRVFATLSQDNLSPLRKAA